MSKQFDLPIAAGEQRPSLIPNLHGLYDKPLSTRRLLYWLVVYILKALWINLFSIVAKKLQIF